MTPPTTGACGLCARLGRGSDGEAPYVHTDGTWRVTPAIRFHDVPGWTYVALGRHVESLDEMTDVEAAEMGRVLARTAAAVERATRAERVYVMTFGEVVPHVHFLLTPRLADLPAEHRGAHIWDHADQLADAERAPVVHRAVLDALRDGARP